MLSFLEAKNLIGQKVKVAIENLDHFTEGQIVEGTLREINYTGKITEISDEITNFVCNVAIIDPKDGGIHYLLFNKIFDIDTKETDIQELVKNERIIILEKELVELKTSIIEKEA